MEVLLYNSGPYHARLQLVDKKTSLFGPFPEKKSQIPSLSVYAANRSIVKNPSQHEPSRSFNTNRGHKISPPRVSNENYSAYVTAGEGLEELSGVEESSGKVLVPGLPDESESATISSSFSEWKPKLTMYYEKAGSENVNSPTVLFLPGFGVGTFHYEKQLKDLGRDYRVWALDFLGQGKSLPMEDPAPLSKNADLSEKKNYPWGFGDKPEPWAEDLVYSVDLWKDQVQYFVEEVIGEPVYVVGNSLGGYVALYFAACSPQWVKGITLLNATPFWGFLPNPLKSPLLSRMFPWAGSFPLPGNVKKVTELLWEKISDPQTIADILKQVYVDHSIDVDKVFSRIVETTQHPAAAASFASIMCAPSGLLSFNESLSSLSVQESNIPICLMYGKEDPWVRPIWGQQVKQKLPDAPYYEISPAGHCPHDEVPEVVNYLLRGWIKNVESQGTIGLPLLDEEETAQFDLTKDVEFGREGSQKLVNVKFFGSRFSFWNQIWSQIIIRIQSLAAPKPQ